MLALEALDPSVVLLLAISGTLGLLSAFGLYHLVVSLTALRFRPAPVATPRPGVPPPRPDPPLVTFLIPAYMDSREVIPCLKSVLAVDYPADRLKVIVVADEDAEGTAEVVRSFILRPGTRVVRNAEGDEVLYAERVTAIFPRADRAGRGKPRALQNALRYAAPEGFVAILDADHLVRPDFLRVGLARFDDPLIGIVQVRRSPKTLDREWLATWDAFEQNVGKTHALASRSRLGAASFYGSSALIRADLLFEIGWENCLAEDTLLNYEVRERGYRVVFTWDSQSREDQVKGLRHYVRQRRRWAAGHMQVLYRKLPSLVSAPLPVLSRLEAAFHLGYYLTALLLVEYWLFRATHYWMQIGFEALLPVLGLSVVAGLAVGSLEILVDARPRALVRGFLAGTLLAFGVLSLVAAHLWPPERALPIPLVVDGILLLAPLAQMVCGYLNGRIRPSAAHVEDHIVRWAAVGVLALPMLFVNLYAALTGILLAAEGAPQWSKTIRTPSIPLRRDVS